MILSKREPAQFRAKMPIDAGRQWCGYHVAVWHLPALTAEIDDMRMDRQILHDEACIAFKARARRGIGLDDLFLVDRQLRSGAAAFAASRASRFVRLGRLLHAARFEIGPAWTALQPGDLVAQRSNHALLLGDLFKQRYHQVLELGV